MDTGLSSSITYYYRVRAYNSAGNSIYSNEVSIRINSVPTAPANLSSSILSNSRIELKWTDQSNNENGFKIERKTGTGSFTEIDTVAQNIQSYIDTGLTSGSTYYYRVRAYNASGNSSYSNEISIKLEQKVDIRLYIGNTIYYVNDKLKEMDTAPIIKDGRTLLPIRYIAESIGATVNWNNSQRKVTITLGDKTIELWIDNNTAKVNGKNVLIDPQNTNVKPIIIPPGRTMLPIRFIVENIGGKIDWNERTQEIKIVYPD